MAIPGKNAELVQAAEVFAAAVKNFDGDPLRADEAIEAG